jgi:hypothetical protein
MRRFIGLTLLLVACGGAPVPGISRSPDPPDAAQGDEAPLRAPPPGREGGTDAPEPLDAPEAGMGPTEGGPEASPDAIAEEGGDSPGSLDGGEDAPAEAEVDSMTLDAAPDASSCRADALGSCACTSPGSCAVACAETYCMARSPSPACASCLDAASRYGGSCYAAIESCDPDAG